MANTDFKTKWVCARCNFVTPDSSPSSPGGTDHEWEPFGRSAQGAPAGIWSFFDQNGNSISGITGLLGDSSGTPPAACPGDLSRGI